MQDGFEEILEACTPEVRDVALRTRALIRDVYPDVVEVPWPRQRVVGYGVGPKKMSEHFCYIAFHSGHVNLGFNYGAELDDPAQILTGPGKLLRHVKITTPADLSRGGLRQLIEEASRHRMPTTRS